MGLMGHMKQIVGDGASYAMLHYGAIEEGKRIGHGADPRDLGGLLKTLDGIMLQETTIVQDDGHMVVLRVRPSAVLDADARVMQGIVLGLVEGALTSSRSSRHKGTLVASPDHLTLEIRRDV